MSDIDNITNINNIKNINETFTASISLSVEKLLSDLTIHYEQQLIEQHNKHLLEIESIKDKFKQELNTIENDALTFKNFGMIKQLDKDNKELTNLLEIANRQLLLYKNQKPEEEKLEVHRTILKFKGNDTVYYIDTEISDDCNGYKYYDAIGNVCGYKTVDGKYKKK